MRGNTALQAAELCHNAGMADTPTPVTFENFVRIESERMFAGIIALAGPSNTWSHSRVPTPVEKQTIIRMNQDTLYSAAIIDVSAGATITVRFGGDQSAPNHLPLTEGWNYLVRLYRPRPEILEVDSTGQRNSVSSLSAGVSKFSVFLGREFNRAATLFRVLVSSPLPWATRVCEIHVESGVLGDGFVVCKFHAAIPGE